jgi:diguanylate cyclase
MDYSEDKDQVAEYMRLAIPLMNQNGVAMTPSNYTVWFEHVSGKNAALSAKIESLLQNGKGVTVQQSKELYEQFFDRGKDQAALNEMRQDLRRLLTEILNFVSAGAVTSANSSNKLRVCLDRLSPDMSYEEIRVIIDQVLEETRVAVSSGDLLTERLNSAVADIQGLKKDLEQAKIEAKTDTLTKLANRKAFDELLHKVTQDADSTGTEVCVIFGDLDHFKNINDSHGHLVGDQVLKVVALSLKGAVKGRDLVVRYGGEEFAILLLNTSLTNVKKLAENIRLDIASKRIQRKDTQESLGTITMSFGIARYFPNEGSESFMQRADRALYMSKRKGRNAISEAPPPII